MASMMSNLVPPVPIGDALAVKEDLSLESAVVTLRKLDARDKTTKIMQYSARFFYWWFATTDPIMSKRVFTLYRTTQRSRKAFRMLKVLDEFVKLRHVISAARKEGSSEKALGFLGYTEALQSARHVIMGILWTFDNLNFLTAANTINFGVARSTRGFSRSWSVASVLSILLGIESLRKTDKKRREVASDYADSLRLLALSPTDDRPVARTGEQCGPGVAEREARLKEALVLANAEHFKSWLVVLKGALDLTCAVNISGMDIPKRLLGRKLNDGIIGVTGCASALCVLYNNWPARPQQKIR